MKWETLKEKIYYWDGAWLDIYVLNASREDWKKWTEYVNDKFQLSFYHGENRSEEGKISFQAISDLWEGKTEFTNDATIKLDTMSIKCNFFDDTEIENFFDPGDLESIEDHNTLMTYMTDISKLIGKPVIMTPENRRETIFVSVDNSEVKINLY